MRDSGRIPGFLAELGELWERYPDYRFGQLVMNLCRDGSGVIVDPWEWEEEEWLERIQGYNPGQISYDDFLEKVKELLGAPGKSEETVTAHRQGFLGQEAAIADFDQAQAEAVNHLRNASAFFLSVKTPETPGGIVCGCAVNTGDVGDAVEQTITFLLTTRGTLADTIQRAIEGAQQLGAVTIIDEESGEVLLDGDDDAENH